MKYRALKLMGKSLLLLSYFVANSVAFAHHNTQSEFGWFDVPTMSFEGKIIRVNWGNPHVSIDIESTGGDVPAGEKWRLVSHPINVMDAHGLLKDQFSEGDTMVATGWAHKRGQPLFWLRAVQVEDGPILSAMRYNDMQDIARGLLDEKGIIPAANLNGSAPQRSGPETVKKLAEMGLLDEDGNVIWPPPG